MVHRDVYPGAIPDPLLYDTSVHGIVDINDGTRDVDQLDLVEKIRTLGPTDGDLAIKELSQYPQMIRHVL